MKLRVGLILTTMVLVGMLLSGVVLAVTKTCNHNCRGTGGDDYLTGSGSNNTLSGLGGADTVKGLGGTDFLFGDPGGDGLSGGPGVDHIYGGTGVDRLNGKQGGDHLKDVEHTPYSSTARSKQRKVDVLIGGRGNDTIRARDGNRDIIRGGPGYDKAYVDKVDKVKGVEKEVVPGGGGGTPQCKDGKDNDGDGKIDFGTGANNGPCCDSLTDDTENTPPKNTPPVAKGDSYSVYEDTHLNVVDGANDILSNDTDADNPNNTNAGLTVKDADSTTQGVQPESGPAQGLLTLNADGSFDYEHTGRCSSKQ